MVLTAGTWTSLDAQNYNAVDGRDVGSTPGDSAGEGWDKAGGSNANQLIEYFLGENGSTLAPNATLTLGNAYNTAIFGAADGDLKFSFGVNNGALVSAPVSYVGTGGTPGDFNGDSKVNGADFLAWQRNNAVGSLATWRTNYGTGAAAPAIGAVPEPATISLVLLAVAALGCRRRG